MSTTERKAKVIIEGEDRFSQTFAAFKRTMADTNRVTAGVQERVAGLGLNLGALGAGFSVAAVLSGVKAVADGFDALNDAADATGEKIEVLSGLEDLARRNGAGLELVTDAMLKLNRGIAEGNADSPVAKALRSIGLSADELRKKAPGEAMREVAQALARYENGAGKAAATQAIFGRSVKEVAPFLNDLAEAGELNAKVTAEQAAQAERFNKELFKLQALASDAARAGVYPLIEALNKLAENGRENGWKGLFGLSSVKEEMAELQTLRAKVGVAAAQVVLAERNALKLMISPESYQADLDKAKAGYQQALQAARDAQRNFYRLTDGDAGAGRGKVNPEFVKPAVTFDTTADAGAAGRAGAASEAQRYLEQLQRQGEATRNLTLYERALLDIQRGRIEGLTPRLREQILQQARQNDLTAQAQSLEEGRVAAQSRAARAELDKVAALVEANAQMERENSAIGLTEAALADVELARLSATIATREQTLALREKEGVDERQLQLLQQEIEALQRRKSLIVDRVGRNAAAESARNALDDVQDRARSGLSESISQGLLEGFRKGDTLGKIFLRELQAQFAKTVLTPRIEPIVNAGNSLIQNLLQYMFGGGFKAFDTNGIGLTSGGQGLADYGLGGGRANGGPVRAGMAYRVGENGAEVFVPQQPGHIVPNGQLGRGGQGGAPMVINQHYTINGDVGPQTVALVQGMVARNNQQLLRSMRTGGAFAS